MTTPSQTTIPDTGAPLRVSARLYDTTVADLLDQLADLPPEVHVRLALPDGGDTPLSHAVYASGLLTLHPKDPA
jgi:hypothetical protein